MNESKSLSALEGIFLLLSSYFKHNFQEEDMNRNDAFQALPDDNNPREDHDNKKI